MTSHPMAGCSAVRCSRGTTSFSPTPGPRGSSFASPGWHCFSTSRFILSCAWAAVWPAARRSPYWSACPAEACSARFAPLGCPPACFCRLASCGHLLGASRPIRFYLSRWLPMCGWLCAFSAMDAVGTSPVLWPASRFGFTQQP